jgi:hypothetical protein
MSLGRGARPSYRTCHRVSIPSNAPDWMVSISLLYKNLLDTSKMRTIQKGHENTRNLSSQIMVDSIAFLCCKP